MHAPDTNAPAKVRAPPAADDEEFQPGTAHQPMKRPASGLTQRHLRRPASQGSQRTVEIKK
jgi:hypothetical protein